MKKALRILKITLLTLLGLLVVAIIAGIIIYQTTFREPVQQIMSSIDVLIESGELFEVEDSETLSSPIDEQVSDQTHEEEDSPLSEEETPNSPPPASPKKPVEEYNSTYDYVKDNVTPSDFKKGSSFASRVDIGYILGLLSGGLTNSEKRELKQYLSERFTQSEIDEGIALYKKYSYLLRSSSKK